jgi:iron complex transport system ATP-binding protein
MTWTAPKIPLLQIEGLSLWRGGTLLLNDVHWTVWPGQALVLLGLNGCGKSTLLRVIQGYEWASEGRLVYQGQVYGDGAPIPAVRRSMGCVGSDLDRDLDPSMRVLDVICSGAVAGLAVHQAWSPEVLERARDLMRATGTAFLAWRHYGNLSSGECRRVLLARALLARPTLLLLDEPCAGLDPPSRADFLHALSGLLRSAGAPTVVYVTHHVEEMTAEISHVGLMNRGTFQAQGKKKEVLTNDNLSQLYGRRVRLDRPSGSGWRLEVVPDLEFGKDWGKA